MHIAVAKKVRVCCGWRTKCRHHTDRKLNISFISNGSELEDELKLWARSAIIRLCIIFIAEIFFHGKEKYMLLRPDIERRESAQTRRHVLSLT